MNTRFETEAKANSVIAYQIVERNSVRLLLHSSVRRDFSRCVANP